MEMTLCFNCASVYYRSADHMIRRKYPYQIVREPCDICTKMGFDFIVDDIVRTIPPDTPLLCHIRAVV